MVWNAPLQIRREMEFDCRCHGGKFQRNWTSDISRYHCVESRSPEEERCNKYDSLHCGIFECRALISQDSISKSAQYLRSSTMEKSVAKENDQLSQKKGAAKSGFFGTDTKEE